MPELADATIAAVDDYWASFFGCAPTIFATSATTVVPHVGLGDYRGLWLFRRRATLIVSVPPGRLEHDRALFGTAPTTLFDDLPAIRACIEAPIERVLGPAFVGYADAMTFRPVSRPEARLLTTSDWAAFEFLRQSCPALDWEHGGTKLGAQPVAGCFAGALLASVAGYERWGERIAHIAVVTHPGYRGHGYGRAVVSALSRVALEQGLIPQYRTLMSNSPSLAVGAALGFLPYAESIAVRLAV
ncbi:MAG TPA: GNAT family N-acetyltransferase [Herpetosiphonaceae bacterium]